MAAFRSLLGKLSDVTVATPTDGQVLTYNEAAGKWENAEGTPGPQGEPGGGGTPSGAAGGVLAGTYPNPSFASDLATQAELDAHISDASAAHAASAISADSTTLIGTGTTVQAVFEELDNAIATDITGLSNHIGDVSAAHTAAAISFTPTGTIVATNVQAAIAEVALEGGEGGGQIASTVPFTPAGTVAATDVQAAIEELAGEIVVGENRGIIDFEIEYSAVRSFTTGNETANETAVANLCDDLRAHATRDGIRKIWFGPSNGKAYWVNSPIELEDLEDTMFVFDGGAEFSGTVGAGSPCGVYFMWSGAETDKFFSIIASGTTIQRGLQWQGSWTFATNTTGYGDMLFVDGVNNAGGPSSVISLTSQGATKYVRKGLVTNNLINGDNAHGVLGALYSGGATLGAFDAIGGGFGILAGNISKVTGHSPARIGPLGSEMKCGEALKFDGDGTLVQCEGSFCDFYGQFEGFDGGYGLNIERTTNAGAGDNSGRYNRIASNFVGRTGTGRAWRVKNTAGGLMYGNRLDMPAYSNCADMSKASDATILPDGEDVFHCGMDYYRLIVGGAYV